MDGTNPQSNKKHSESSQSNNFNETGKPQQPYIFCGSHDKHIYCWNGDTLELEWKTNLEAEVYSTPFCGVVQATVENSAESKEYPTTIASPLPTVCVCSTIGLICLLNPQTGDIFARFRLPGDVFSSPVLLNNYIVVGCRNDYVYCLRLECVSV